MQGSAYPAFDPLAGLRAAAAAREAAGLRRYLVPRAADDATLDLASNDYLGLSGDPRLAEAAAVAARVWGTGATGSRLVTGSTALHAELEAELTAFTGAAAALVFSSGYLANLAATTALTAALSGDGGAGVLIVSDERNHASLVDACRLARRSGVRVLVTPHGDVAAGAALAALRVLRTDPGLPGRARRAAAELAAAAAELGLTVTAPAAAVTAVVLGDPRDALAAQRGCAECGVRVGCFRPPSVPAGEACLRLTGRATLTEKDLAAASRALAVARDHCHHCRNTAQAGRNTP
jgi:7-keto-8-aminopelargonate synthetase-like enzyme